MVSKVIISWKLGEKILIVANELLIDDRVSIEYYMYNNYKAIEMKRLVNIKIQKVRKLDMTTILQPFCIVVYSDFNLIDLIVTTEL